MSDSDNNNVDNQATRQIVGDVISTKMDKTIVVRTDMLIGHPVLKKTMKRTKKVYGHDPEGQASEGDRVLLIQSRPLSKLKRYRLKQIIERAK